MENGSQPEERTDTYSGLFDRLLLYVGLIGIFSAIIAFYALLPSTFNSVAQIKQLNPYTYFLLDLTTNDAYIFALLIISAVLVTLSIASIFYSKEGPSIGTKVSRRMPFFRYISIFILVELVLSLISPEVSSSFVNNPVLKMPLGAQNFVFISSSVSQTIILQFLPITILSVLFLGITRNLSLKTFLNPDVSLKRFEVVIVIIASAFGSLMTSVDIGSAVLNFASFFVLNIIYMRFGLMRAIVAGFTISEFNIILQLNQFQPIPYIMYIFLIVWSLIGVYSFITMFTRSAISRQAARHEETPKHDQSSDVISAGNPQNTRPPHVNSTLSNPDNFWIRSPCPSCGNLNFDLKEDMALECKNCHHVLSRDAVGEFSIRLIRSRTRN